MPSQERPSGSSGSGRNPPDGLPPLTSEQREHLQSVEWWSQLLFWLVLEDRKHMQLLDEPSRGTVMETLRTASNTGSGPPGTSVFPQRVVQLHERLASQFESVVAISPLWQAWFTTVHGPMLQEVGRELLDSVSSREALK